MSAKKKKKIIDLRTKSEHKKRTFIEKMKLAVLESDQLTVKNSRHEDFQKTIVMFEDSIFEDRPKVITNPSDNLKISVKDITQVFEMKPKQHNTLQERKI